MGSRLMSWALNQKGLTPKEQIVLTSMCKVAHDNHGRFWKNVHTFLDEDVPCIDTHSALRNHLASLSERGLIGRIRKGNGKNRTKRGSQTEYQILAREALRAEEFVEFEKIEARRPRRKPPLQGKLRTFVSMDGGTSDIQESQNRTSKKSDVQDSRMSSPADVQDSRMSGEADIQGSRPLYMTTNRHDYQEATALKAAASESDFFQDVAKACASIGVHGVFPSDFQKLRPKLKGIRRRLDFDDAKWIADDFKLASRVKKVRKGLLIHIVSQFLEHGGDHFFVEDTPDTWGTHDKPSSDVINF